MALHSTQSGTHTLSNKPKVTNKEKFQCEIELPMSRCYTTTCLNFFDYVFMEHDDRHTHTNRHTLYS